MSLLQYGHRLSPPLRRLEAGLIFLVGYVRFNHILFAAVFFLSALSFWISYELRFDFQVVDPWTDQRLLLLPYVAALKLFVFYLLRGHSSNWRYVGLHDVPILFLHCALSAVVIRWAAYLGQAFAVPKGVILIDFLLSMVLIGGARIGIRIARERVVMLREKSPTAKERRVVVIGAGDAGEMIIREIARNPRSGMRVQAIFDDDPAKRGSYIHGVKVIGRIEEVRSYVRDNPVRTAIVAIPTADRAQMKRIHDLIKDTEIPIKTLPSLHEIIDASSKLTQLRDMDITDLLGREEVRIDSEQVRNLIHDKVVFVTGAGGSIGSELCRQILKRKPRRIVLIERSENNLFHIHRRLIGLLGPDLSCEVVPVLCDVCDPGQVEFEFGKFRPELVFHAAAFKHVPMQELNPVECFKNNIGGTRTLVRASHAWGVARFLLISTDKAVNPSSVMGATKRACEIYCSAYGLISETKFLSVRFGNVLASEGSVVPLFMEQIAKGGPVTVTHPEMRRYFMTISEAATLVLQAAALGDSGQIMVLDMGEPIKIVDMALQLIQLMGRHPEEIPLEFVGTRPGEKLFEQISATGEAYQETSHSKIRIFKGNGGPPSEIIEKMDRLIDGVDWDGDTKQIRRILKEIVTEYDPGTL